MPIPLNQQHLPEIGMAMVKVLEAMTGKKPDWVATLVVSDKGDPIGLCLGRADFMHGFLKTIEIQSVVHKATELITNG